VTTDKISSFDMVVSVILSNLNECPFVDQEI
jgi:hypothetical protein